MFSKVFVISTHDCPYLSFLNSCFESWQIYLSQCTLISYYIDSASFCLLIIEGEVLNTSSNTIELYPYYVRHYHSGGQVRVLTHVFEVSAIERGSVNIYAWTKKHGFLPVSGFFSDSFPIVRCQLRVPCCSKGC